MSQPKRWLDDGAPREFERLLRAARSDRPSPVSVERALLAAGITGAAIVTSSAVASAGASGAAAAGAGGKTFIAAATQWLAVGAIGAVAVAASAVAILHHEPTRAPAAPHASAARVEHPKASKTAVPVEPDIPEPELAKTTAVSPPLPSSDSLRARMPSTPTEGVELDRSLAEEMALVDSARSELRAGDALSVLKRAAEHSRRFAAGRFAPEMLFLKMQAKLMLGRREAAADTARELVRRFPSGAQASRARELLESNADARNH